MVKKYNDLKKFFQDNNIKMVALAKEMGISRSQFSKKINRINGADFKADEIRFLCSKYNLDANKFFLMANLQYKCNTYKK